MFTILVILVAILATAFSQQWTVDTATQEGMMIGVGVGSKTSAIAAGNSDSQGPIATIYDGSKWSQEKGLIQSALIMDGAISADGKTAVYSSMGGISISTDSGASFARVEGIAGLSQDVHMFGGEANSMAAVGTFVVLPSSQATPGSFSGLAVSTDGVGAKWDVNAIPNESYPRYGDFPSASTWYVSAGMWNSTESSVNAKESDMHLTSRVKIDTLTGKKSVKVDVQDGSDGWYGAIYKTADAGQTWTAVYNTPTDEQWYFNQISCPTEDLCVAVGEGQQGSSPYTVALVSNDGGATWKKTMESTTYMSLMGVEMTSATNGFITPANANRQTGTDFLVTTDGGQTWALSQTLDACYCMDIDSQDGFGVASCLTQSAGAIAMYQ